MARATILVSIDKLISIANLTEHGIELSYVLVM